MGIHRTAGHPSGLNLALKMTTSQVVEMSITVNNSPIQDYIHPQDYTQPTYELTPGFKCFAVRVIKHENKKG